MKRKFKLFATIASLCLSVALMAFGVYAATQATYNVSSSVSFVAQVKCTFTAAVVDGNDADISNNAANAEFVVNGNETDAAVSQTWAANGLEFSNAQYKNVIKYTFTCTNTGAQPIAVALDLDSKYVTVANVMTLGVKESVWSNSEIVETARADMDALIGIASLPASETYTIELTLTLTDFSRTLTQQTLTLALIATPIANPQA